MCNLPLTVTRLDPGNAILLYAWVLDPTILITRVMRWPTVYNANLRRLESLTIGTVILLQLGNPFSSGHFRTLSFSLTRV